MKPLQFLLLSVISKTPDFKQHEELKI